MKSSDVGQSVVPSLLKQAAFESYFESPWLVIRDLPIVLAGLNVDAEVYVHPTATVDPSARVIRSYIGAGVKLYEGTVVRDSIVLSGATIGHASEIARSLVMPEAMVPRFNYLGSSLIGEGVQLGGSVMCASHRHDWRPVSVRWGTAIVRTEMVSLGSIIGDEAIVAFGNHLNPGTVVGKHAVIYPGNDLSGFFPPHTIVRKRERLIQFRRRDLPDLGVAFVDLRDGQDT